jgi:alcohol dehydrogenase class IV
MQDETAKKRYHDLAKETNVLSIIDQVKSMNKALNIPSSFKSLIENEQDFLSKVDEMAALSMKDGCTKTNPIIPPMEDFAHLIKLSYYGKDKH